MYLCMSMGLGGMGCSDFLLLILFAVSFFSVVVVFNLCKALCATFLYEKCHTNKD